MQPPCDAAMNAALLNAEGGRSMKLPRQPRAPPEVDVEVPRCVLPTPAKTYLSDEFKSLVDKLMQQHVADMMELECLEPTSLGLDEVPNMSSKWQRMMSPSVFSAISGYSAVSDSGTLSKTIMRKQHEQMRTLEADHILDTLLSEDQLHSDSITPSAAGPAGVMESLKRFLDSRCYAHLIAVFLTLNVLWMAFQLQIFGSTSEILASDVQPYLIMVDTIFAALFALDVTLRTCTLGCRFFLSPLNFLDLTVAVAAISEIVVLATRNEAGISLVVFQLLRVGKLCRAMRVVGITADVAPLQLLIKCLEASKDMLFWSFVLLTFIQCVAGVLIGVLCQDFLLDAQSSPEAREEVYVYYGTFTRTFLSMFEIMFANWGPPCRILVENISEWFSLFFLLYRCVVGFAVLNVVGSVFVQQTMKTASSDEELAFKQKQKDIAQYTRKVKRLFQTIDSSGDGTISLDEFERLVQSPKLQFWMSQLELEYHDLLSLFEFLDNGDGQITLTEFIEGAGRLRGSSKAIDIWRLETKIEVLFQEVFNNLKGPIATPLLVQEIFNNSSFKHIHTTKTPDLETIDEHSAGPASPMEHLSPRSSTQAGIAH
ncbi:unnamed protein product [Effrenium voratum]|uniref:EF-hand domain-containing protein n=1 Tax=Effrenium voratum TaxID=2562239 RepID=A0AA36N4P4_9DINO|nr:unnamed protein product [Effrenium voratum]